MSIPRLLVVDDDLEMRAMMTEFLRKSGFMVMTASSRTEIEKHLDDGRIDLILLDVMLGDESGVEICGALRQERDVPIILVSALSADHQRMAGYEVGADDYIAKPFNPDLMLARIPRGAQAGQADQAGRAGDAPPKFTDIPTPARTTAMSIIIHEAGSLTWRALAVAHRFRRHPVSGCQTGHRNQHATCGSTGQSDAAVGQLLQQSGFICAS
ncbi:Transcriptional regulatory protein OmpR [Nymphon striatum]|nr:Transcriptional regulatory protein OmpR [Nymphon striatum]